MKKIEKCRKYSFSGKFGCDGVSGGETYPYWLVSEEVYKSIIKDYDLEFSERQGNLYKLYMYQLFDKNCGKHIYNLIGNVQIQGEYPVYPPESFQPANIDIKQPKHGDKTICPYCNEQWHN